MNADSAALPRSDFQKAILWSAAGHAFVALTLIIRSVFFPGEPLRIENAIRVDIVGLPEKSATLPDLPAEPPPPVESPPAPPKESAKKDLPTKPKESPETVVLKPKKPDPKESRKNQDAALKRLEAMARLERQARADAAQKAIEAASAKARPSGAIKGNEISKGTALTGLTRLDHNRYLDDIEARVRKVWSPPKFLSKAGLRVRVVLLIDEHGVIVDQKIVQSSGNSVFDDSALGAIERAQPFAPPPDSLKGLLSQQGVELDLEPAGYR